MNKMYNKVELEQQMALAKLKSRKLAQLSTQKKNLLLKELMAVLASSISQILHENAKDLQRARENALSEAMIDRLLLDESRIQGIINAVDEICALEDPVGLSSGSYLRENGIRVSKQSIPLGVILMIYESRPNVTIEAAALCLKSGNAAVLRGGSEAFYTNQALAKCWHEALKRCHAEPEWVNVLETTDREAIKDLLVLKDSIDLVIPRGGEGLIHFVVDNSKIPVIQHDKGVCHLFVDESADLEMALSLLIDGKTSRPGVCNALETLLVHQNCAKKFLEKAIPALLEKRVEIRGCDYSRQISNQVIVATDDDYAKEFLALILSIKVVKTMEEAIEHIYQYGSNHTEVIVTNDLNNSQRFVQMIDSSVVMVNASSRFSDGGQLGLGAEIGISTSKFHAYGPMGLKALTTEKFVIMGDGQIRH